MGFFCRKIRELATPISREGIAVKDIESQGYAGGIKATDFLSGQRPEIFTPSTVILHGGHAVWELEVPEDVLKNLIHMTLKIETVRTHGMLHTPEFERSTKERRYARIMVNGELVDKISLVKPHPHGDDLGVDSRRSIPVFRYIDRSQSTQEIRIEVDDKVLWDIDYIILEPIVLREELTPEAGMVLGAIISTLAGGVLNVLVS